MRCGCKAHEPAVGETNGIFSLPALRTSCSCSCPACLLYLLAACTWLLARSHSIKWYSQQVTCWANFTQIYRVLSSLSHYLFNVRCSYCNSGHVTALTYFNLQQIINNNNNNYHIFEPNVCISFCMCSPTYHLGS